MSIYPFKLKNDSNQNGNILRARASCWMSLLLTWTDASCSHLRGHQPGQMLDLGVGARWLHRRVCGLEGGRHDVWQIHHADEHLNNQTDMRWRVTQSVREGQTETREQAAHQVGYVLRGQQRVQELRCQVDGRLGPWNRSWFRERQRGRLLFVLIIFNQCWLWTQKHRNIAV